MGFPFVRRSTYEAERKNRLAWMQKSADNEREMLNATRKLEAVRKCLCDAQVAVNTLPDDGISVLED